MEIKEFFSQDVIEPLSCPTNKKDLLERKKEIADLITKVVLRCNKQAHLETKLFWFWYDNMIPENLRLNSSHMGMVIKEWRSSQSLIPEPIDGNGNGNGTIANHNSKGSEKIFKTINYEKVWEGIEGPLFFYGEIRKEGDGEGELYYSEEHNRLCSLIGRKTLDLDETQFMNLFSLTKKQKWKSNTSRDLPYETKETDQSFEYILSLPGTIKLDFSFEEKSNSLVIDGERHLENAPFQSKTFWSGPFQKKIKLSTTADETKVNYSSEGGFLYLHVPKKETRTKKIMTIQSPKTINVVTNVNIVPNGELHHSQPSEGQEDQEIHEVSAIQEQLPEVDVQPQESSNSDLNQLQDQTKKLD